LWLLLIHTFRILLLSSPTNPISYFCRPAKQKDGMPHPDAIVETSSLSSIFPPDITYKHHLQDCAEKKLLSDAQLETIVYAMMRFDQRLPCGESAWQCGIDPFSNDPPVLGTLGDKGGHF
jgi:hypothetical protein